MRSLLTAATLLIPSFSLAQGAGPQCAPAEMVIEYLGQNHREAPVATMMRGPERLIIFASEDGTTWTIVVQRDSMFCMLTEGQGFLAIKYRAPGRAS